MAKIVKLAAQNCGMIENEAFSMRSIPIDKLMMYPPISSRYLVCSFRDKENQLVTAGQFGCVELPSGVVSSLNQPQVTKSIDSDPFAPWQTAEMNSDWTGGRKIGSHQDGQSLTRTTFGREAVRSQLEKSFDFDVSCDWVSEPFIPSYKAFVSHLQRDPDNDVINEVRSRVLQFESITGRPWMDVLRANGLDSAVPVESPTEPADPPPSPPAPPDPPHPEDEHWGAGPGSGSGSGGNGWSSSWWHSRSWNSNNSNGDGWWDNSGQGGWTRSSYPAESPTPSASHPSIREAEIVENTPFVPRPDNLYSYIGASRVLSVVGTRTSHNDSVISTEDTDRECESHFEHGTWGAIAPTSPSSPNSLVVINAGGRAYSVAATRATSMSVTSSSFGTRERATPRRWRLARPTSVDETYVPTELQTSEDSEQRRVKARVSYDPPTPTAQANPIASVERLVDTSSESSEESDPLYASGMLSRAMRDVRRALAKASSGPRRRVLDLSDFFIYSEIIP